MSRPAFTVVTANYNSGDKLAATAASVREQGVAAEHLIVDGASKDESLTLALRLAAEVPHAVRVISEPDRGVYDAMNKGVRAAAGRYLYFLGAGDVLRPGALRDIETYLPSGDDGMLYGDVMYYGRRYDGPFDYVKLTRRNLCHQAAFYGRDVFARLGGYDLNYRALADWEFNLRCFGDRRLRPRHVPVLVADFEPGGISAASDGQFWADNHRLLRRHYGFLRYWRVRIGRIPDRLRIFVGAEPKN